MRNFSLPSLVILAVAITTSGCTRPEPSSPLERYRAQNTDLQKIRRIAILPIDARGVPQQSVELINSTLATALAARYDVVPLQRRPSGLVQPAGAALLDDLVDANDRLMADAVLQVKITDYRPYEPPAITMSMRMISTTNAQVLWSVTGTLDSARPSVEKRLKEYYAKSHGADDSLLGWRALLMVERRYAQFAANEFLLSMGSQARRP